MHLKRLQDLIWGGVCVQVTHPGPPAQVAAQLGWGGGTQVALGRAFKPCGESWDFLGLGGLSPRVQEVRGRCGL